MEEEAVYRGRTIQVKLICLIVFIATSIFVGYTIYTHCALKQAMNSELETLSELWAKQLAESLKPPLWNVDRPSLVDIVNSAPLLERQIYALLVRDQYGELIYGVRRDKSWKIVQSLEELPEKEYLWREPVLQRFEQIGGVEIAFSDRFMKEKLREELLRNVLIIIILNFGLITSLLIGIRLSIVLPLRRIVAIVRSIAMGDLDREVRMSRKDEIGQLASDINVMRIAIREMTGSLQSAKCKAEESEARLRMLSDNLPGGLVYQLEGSPYGKSRRYTYISAGVEELYGVSPRSVLDEPELIYRQVVPEDLRRMNEMGLAAANAMKPLRMEIKIKPPSGGSRWHLISSAPRKLAEGEVVWDGVEIDITEHKRSEQLLAAKNRELEQLVYVASHDLRSPLVNIDGYARELEYSLDDLADMLGRDELACEKFESELPDMRSYLNFIRSSAKQMDSLLKGLLKLSRSGRTVLKIKALDMNRLISSVLSTFAFQADKSGIDIQVGDLPACMGDEIQVAQVFSNLIGNAIKFMVPSKPGVISITGRVEPEGAVYSVRDNGMGIAAEHQEQIFELFHRLNPSFSEGEGLGLSIVLRVLERMDGQIRLESEEGEGSSFFVTLPALDFPAETDLTE